MSGFRKTPTVLVVPCGPERAAEVHRLTRLAFLPQQNLSPPSSAASETLVRVADDLAAGGAAIATDDDGRATGCLRWRVTPEDYVHVRRLAVEPLSQGRGIGRTLMTWVEAESERRGCHGVTLGVLVSLPRNLEFFEALGFSVIDEHRHDGYDRTTWVRLRKEVGPVRQGKRAAPASDVPVHLLATRGLVTDREEPT